MSEKGNGFNSNAFFFNKIDKMRIGDVRGMFGFVGNPFVLFALLPTISFAIAPQCRRERMGRKVRDPIL